MHFLGINRVSLGNKLKKIDKYKIMNIKEPSLFINLFQPKYLLSI